MAALRVPALNGLLPDRVGAPARAFLVWWLGELQAMVPARLRRLLRAHPDLVLFDVDDRAVRVRRLRAQGEDDIGQVNLEKTDTASRRAQFDAFADQLGGTRKQVVVRLPRNRVLRKVLNLPAAARENLREILSFEMDRTTPFTADEVYFTYRIVEIARQSKRLSAELLILPRASADPALDLVRAWGLSVDRLELQTDGPRGEAPPQATVDFLPAVTEGSAAPRRRPMTMLLTVTTLALLLAAMVLPLRQQNRLIETLRADVAVAKTQADAGRRQREEMEQSITQSNFIVERKERRPAFVDVLDELTALLPDKTWLIRIRYYNGEIQAFGNSPTASALIGALEDSPLFTNTQFRAPVTRDPRLGVERFHIGSQVADREEAS